MEDTPTILDSQQNVSGSGILGPRPESCLVANVWLILSRSAGVSSWLFAQVGFIPNLQKNNGLPIAK